MSDRWLLLETSSRVGEVGVAEGGRLIASARLDAGRHHARDLTPTIAHLLDRAGWRPADVSAVAVSVGPGSYTGLRIGVITAKAFAYANGCRVAAAPTFHIIARQTNGPGLELEVVADALKGKVYAQSFSRATELADWRPVDDLAIVLSTDWRSRLRARTLVSGPGIGSVGAVPTIVSEDRREPRVESLYALAVTGAYDHSDIFSLEPLYLRPSSAEEQWDARLPRD